MAALHRALPAGEYRAVEAWVSCFHGYQQTWLLDWSRFGLLDKSRQIGGSHTYGGAAVLWSLFGETTSIISKGQRESDEVLDKCIKHSKALAELGSEWARGQHTATEIDNRAGGRIISLPASSGGRGYSGNVILDEFGYHEDPDKVWDAASAATLLGYRLRVLSTPNGTGNLFHKLWSDPRAHAGYSRHLVTIEEAIAGGLKVDLDTCWKIARGDPRLFDQLFRGVFLDGADQYIPTALIEAASVEDIYCPQGETFAGLDIGRSNDLTALVIVRLDPYGTGWVIAVETKKRTSEDDIIALGSLAMHSFRCTRLCVDATGLGVFPTERLQQIFGHHRVEAVPFTPKSKEDLATTLFQRLADRQLKIPRANAELRNDLCAIRRIITSAGNVRYEAPVTDDGHADRAWALALALHGYRRPPNVRHEVY